MKLMTIKKAVKDVFNNQISSQLLYQACREKKLPHIIMGKCKILLEEETLYEWIKNQLLTSTQKQHEYGKLRKIEE